MLSCLPLGLRRMVLWIRCMCWRIHVPASLAKLDADLLEMALHLEEKFYPHLLTTISGRSNVHGKVGRSLADVAAYNPVAKADYNSTLQRLREVDFPLLYELNSHKDASVEDIINLLLLEGPLADAPGISDLQPNVDQLMLPVYRSKDQVVLGETSLSFSLSVTHSQVERIRENVAAQWSTLIGVWAFLVDHLSAENLVGAASTSDSVPATVATITTLSTTFAFASSGISISTLVTTVVVFSFGQSLLKCPWAPHS
ncbi:hypothetical protein Tco_0934686 [Tanacetum coccineum]